jgi:Asp-tRNA(Asn)/Glu-tRNA(Gln) amidotransferase A subunit family amidase
VTEAALARIEQRNPALNRSTAITAARALATARAARQLAPSMFATLARLIRRGARTKRTGALARRGA